MVIGQAGYVVRTMQGEAAVEPDCVHLYWAGNGITVVRNLDGATYALSEGELFLPEINEYTGVKVFVGRPIN